MKMNLFLHNKNFSFCLRIWKFFVQSWKNNQLCIGFFWKDCKLFHTIKLLPVPYKNLEFRSEHLKILPNSDLVQTWCIFRLDLDMPESGLRQASILSQMNICSSPDSDLEDIWVRSGADLVPIWADLTHTCSRSESGLEKVCFVTKSIPASVLIQTLPCQNETFTMSGQYLK